MYKLSLEYHQVEASKSSYIKFSRYRSIGIYNFTISYFLQGSLMLNHSKEDWVNYDLSPADGVQIYLKKYLQPVTPQEMKEILEKVY